MGCHQGPMCKESRQQQLLIACLMNLSSIPPMRERPNGGLEMQLFMESLPQCLPSCACHLQTLILTRTWVFMPSLFQYVPLKIMQFCLELRFVTVATKWDWMGWIMGPSGSMMFEFRETICWTDLVMCQEMESTQVFFLPSINDLQQHWGSLWVAV